MLFYSNGPIIQLCEFSKKALLNKKVMGAALLPLPPCISLISCLQTVSTLEVMHSISYKFILSCWSFTDKGIEFITALCKDENFILYLYTTTTCMRVQKFNTCHKPKFCRILIDVITEIYKANLRAFHLDLEFVCPQVISISKGVQFPERKATVEGSVYQKCREYLFAFEI